MDVIYKLQVISIFLNHNTDQVAPFMYLMLLCRVSSCFIVKYFRLFNKSQFLCFYCVPHKSELPKKQQNKGNGPENVKKRRKSITWTPAPYSPKIFLLTFHTCHKIKSPAIYTERLIKKTTGCICTTRQHLLQIIQNLVISKKMKGLCIVSLMSTQDLFQTLGRVWQHVSQMPLSTVVALYHIYLCGRSTRQQI